MLDDTPIASVRRLVIEVSFHHISEGRAALADFRLGSPPSQCRKLDSRNSSNADLSSRYTDPPDQDFGRQKRDERPPRE